ncbi:FecR domain-containing protein [Pseudomonas sp. UBA7530]|uniref:FecR family protein n=1 Tax=Pseudomonas sp. UBA7530 TaxID=1947341 RepID=UPI0025CE0971|nr:FecR domain-containing protein [Pseudomonas sp. UBA7530]
MSELDDQASELLLRLHAGGKQAAARAEWQRWRRQSLAHARAARDAEALWAALEHTDSARRHRQQNRAARRWRLPAMAAALCLGLLLTLLGRPQLLENLSADHYTAVGERRLIELEDGSRVWLNSDSALSVRYSAGARDLELQRGQALFEVAKDAQRPFVVQAANGQVRAVGTRFDIALRADRVQVEVSEGVVQVRSGAAPGVRVDAGQRLDYRQRQAPGPLQVLDLDNASSWQRGKLIFNQRPLGEVLAELERYMPGRIVIEDAALREQRISGVVDLDQPEALLANLERLQPLRITRLPWLVLVQPR